MAMEIQQTKDTIVDNLTVTGGDKLVIMANIQSGGQAMAVLESFVGASLGSKFERQQMDLMLGITVSWLGRGREDLTGIGKTPDIQGWQKGNED